MGPRVSQSRQGQVGGGPGGPAAEDIATFCWPVRAFHFKKQCLPRVARSPSVKCFIVLSHFSYSCIPAARSARCLALAQKYHGGSLASRTAVHSTSFLLCLLSSMWVTKQRSEIPPIREPVLFLPPLVLFPTYTRNSLKKKKIPTHFKKNCVQKQDKSPH